MNAYSPISEAVETNTISDMIAEWHAIYGYLEADTDDVMPEEVSDALATHLLHLESEIYETPAASADDFMAKARLAFNRLLDGRTVHTDDGLNALLADIDRLQKHSTESISLDGSGGE